jgi:O-methyltransferase involved in polyketide biosynthesis
VFPRGSDAISPTAHYTAEVWRRNGLSDPALGTWQGRLMHLGLWPLATVAGTLGAGTLDGMLIARHRLIDELLTEAVEDGSAGQIVEIAAGLSPRGLRFRREHPDISYVEADLPAMAERKRAALASAGAPHRVADLDALAERGPGSLAELVASLDAERGTAIVTEGLLNYFPRDEVEGIWARIAAALGSFPSGLYTADLLLQSDNSGPVERAFGAALGVFVRGAVHFPFADEEDALDALEAAGFKEARLHPGTESGDDPGAERVTVIEARVQART